jgi:predicted transposase YdaD
MTIVEPAKAKKDPELSEVILASERLAGMAEGLVQGAAQGRVEGRVEGASVRTLEMVTNMLNRKTIPLAEISAISGMKEDEVLSLQAGLGL